MSSLNKVLLLGNLTRDPEVRYTPKGTAIAEIGLAVSRVYSGDDGEKKEEVTFVDVTLWGRQAEVAQEYLRKGQPVFIEGRLRLDSWQDKQSGQKRSRLRVVCENLQLLGNRTSSSKPQQQNPQKPDSPSTTTASERKQPREPQRNEDDEPDNIPF